MCVCHCGCVTRHGEAPHAGSIMLGHAHVRSSVVSASSIQCSPFNSLSNRCSIETCLHLGLPLHRPIKHLALIVQPPHQNCVPDQIRKHASVRHHIQLQRILLYVPTTRRCRSYHVCRLGPCHPPPWPRRQDDTPLSTSPARAETMMVPSRGSWRF